MASRSQNYRNSEVKDRINERLENVVIDSGKLSQAITKSSRSREILYQCTKSFVSLDSTMSNTDQSLKLIEGNLVKLDAQADRLNETCPSYTCQPGVPGPYKLSEKVFLNKVKENELRLREGSTDHSQIELFKLTWLRGRKLKTMTFITLCQTLHRKEDRTSRSAFVKIEKLQE